jgi:hypothetical protein
MRIPELVERDVDRSLDRSDLVFLGGPDVDEHHLVEIAPHHLVPLDVAAATLRMTFSATNPAMLTGILSPRSRGARRRVQSR